MAETAGTAGAALPTESPVTSDDIAAFANAEEVSSPSTPTDADTPGPATVDPATSGTTVPDGSAGPIPFDRHKSILEHARSESRAAAEKEWKSRFGWAERYQPEQVEQGSRLYQWLNTNPRQFAAWLKSQIGDEDLPSGARAPEAGPPEPDLRAEDGTPVFSAPQLQKYMEWQTAQLQKQWEPVQRKIASQEERERLQQTVAEAKSQANGLLSQARSSWPLFKDLEPAMFQAMQEDPSLSFHDAYIRVFSATGPNKLREQWTADVTGTLARKADASTSPPGRPGGTPRKWSEMPTEDVVKDQWESLTRKR